MLVVKRSHCSLLSHHQVLLNRITLRVRQSLELQEILETTVAEVRSFLGTDRVKVYRFHEDGSGEVIAEAIQDDRLPSLLRLNFPANDIPADARELFIQARQRVAVDVVAQSTTGLSLLNSPNLPPNLSPNSDDSVAVEDVSSRPVDHCHVNYLTTMGVKSSVVVPILHAEQLWGLLISHHAQQRTVTEEELELIGAVADQVEVAIAQSMLLNQVREQAEREAKINQFTTQLHQGATIQLQVVIEEAANLFQASGGRLYLIAEAKQQTDELYVWGEQPAELINHQDSQIEKHSIWRQYLRNEHPNLSCWATNDLCREPLFAVIAPSFQPAKIRGVLIVPLRYKEQLLGYLTLFRKEIETERLWAGQCENGVRQPTLQLSFEPWQERRAGQIRAWTETEKNLAQTIGNHLSTAVQQYRLYAQVQLLNANLEQQVQERTVELQRLLEQQQALSSVITKIRASLKLDIIFQTTTEEVYRLLKVDRVAIYRFNADWSGVVVAEAVGSGWIELRHAQSTNTDIKAYVTTSDRCIISSFPAAPVANADTYLQDTQGGDFSRGCQVKQVDDIYTMNFSTCYLKVLESLQCRAYVIIPIFQANQLWGLLAVYQNAAPRQWNTSDVELIRQTAAQLEVAIQQAELFEQTQSQANQLSQMLVDLRQTQSQLIQTEKMSSLGQLVAGVAHEINNPINFIHGNLTPATQYAQDLLELLALYQQCLPHPNEKLREKLAEVDLEFVAEDLPKLLASMQVGTERIREIVRSLRTFSRIDEAEFKAVDLHDGIDSTLMILKHRLQAKSDRIGIRIVKDYGQLPLVECYPGQLNQVFMNLFANAIDALEERDKERSTKEILANPSTIKVRTHLLDNQWVSIHIIDNGSGMSEKVRSQLFDPFFTTKPVGKGTGLGLSISYQIITEKHGGKLECCSTLGRGTEFLIQIPTRQPIEQR